MSYTVQDLDAAVIDAITSGACDPVSNRKNALASRAYGEDARRVILAKRAEYQSRRDATARQWQHSYSRRALRNAHFDTVAARERYVRGVSGFDEWAWLASNPAYIEHGRWNRHPVKGFQSGRVSS
jgi:hypothetical protein